MRPQTTNDDAAKARASGNDLYRAGKLLQAEKAYEKAASLAPHDSSPVSNLSAVRYEMGDYKGAIAYIKDALSLSVHGTDDMSKNDKLYSRLAKCFLYRLDFGSAEDAIRSIGDSRLRSELYESVESARALWLEIPDESVLRRQILDQIPQYKPWLQDIPEYYCVGHDQVAALSEPLGLKATARRDVSFFFAGSGDGRNLFYAMLSLASKEANMQSPLFRKLHFTVLDLKPAALARLLILFRLMALEDDTEIGGGHVTVLDSNLVMAYIFSCQIIPPFVEAKLQSCIRGLIERLEGRDAAVEFAYVREHDRAPLIRVLRQWQQPWAGLSRVRHVRRFVKDKHWQGKLRTWSSFGRHVEHGSVAERQDFEKFSTLLPSPAVVSRREPSLVGPLATYRSTGKSKKLLRYIDANWRVNNTLIDYDFANRSREQGNERCHPLEFHPLEVTEAMGIPGLPKTANMCSIEQLAEVFCAFSFSVLTLSPQKQLVVEIIVGEMADTMERIRYNSLDYRLSPPNDSQALNPTLFPRTYDYIHMSNIPDYIGGHLTSFLAGRPLLKEDRPSSLRFSNLLNPPAFENHQSFQSEYLLMYDMERIRQHFLVTRRPGEISKEDLLPMLGIVQNPFIFEDYMIWDRAPRRAMSFQQLLPKAEFEKWVYGHLLKICLPYPRPIFSGQPVYAPLNLTSLIRLVISMFEVGYPAHWLLRILSCICAGVITTCARPPTQLVYQPADVDATRPAKEISVQPWVAELTTLLSIWRRLLPWGMDSLDGRLVALGTIFQYSITFPPFAAECERIPHFILVFWNTEVGYTTNPPASIYSLLVDGGGGDSHVSARDIREKGIVCVTAFHYTTDSRTAVFWMRADKMEQMMAGKWRAFIWRTDEWTAVTAGVNVSSGVATVKKWTMLSQKP